MTNHKKTSEVKAKFKPTIMTPELTKELADPKGWITGRLLSKRSKSKNKKMELKGKGKGKPKPAGKKRWSGVTKEEDIVVTPDGVKTEEEVEDEAEDVEDED